MEIFLSLIGVALTFVGVCFSLILFYKSEDEYIVIAYEHLQSLDSYLSQLVSFAYKQMKISNQSLTKSYEDFMLKTRALDCYLPYFLYKQDFSVLTKLTYMDKDISSIIEKKSKLCSNIRKVIFNSRTVYRNSNNATNLLINNNDYIHFKNVFDEVRELINIYQETEQVEKKKECVLVRMIKVLTKNFYK